MFLAKAYSCSHLEKILLEIGVEGLSEFGFINNSASSLLKSRFLLEINYFAGGYK